MDIKDLMNFLDASPTSWHAVEFIVQRLSKKGFETLDEKSRWNLKPGGRYLVQRNGSTLCAFIVPKKAPLSAKIVGSHTDSPGFKLKPHAEFVKENMVMLGLEIYGSPLITSWLNRDLGIAGKIAYHNAKGDIQHGLVRLDKHPIVLPQLAIHLDRNVNEQGLTLNKQDHLAALAAVENSPSKKKKLNYLDKLLKEQIPYKSLLAADLFLFPLEPARLMGSNGEMIAGWRIDSLGSVHAVLTGFLKNLEPSHDTLKSIVFWDHEEIGSNTAQGAGSPFAAQILERLTLSLDLDRQDYLRLLQNSFCISVDLAHALHPNYPEKHEPNHQLLLNKGIAIKSSAQQRYASDAWSSAIIVSLCEQNDIPYQRFVSRGNIPSGTTIGPIHAQATGMKTVDIGCTQLSMHSCRELAGTHDHQHMCKLIEAFFSNV